MSQLAITTSVITWNMLHVNANPLSKTERSHTACLYCLDCHTEYFENVFALFVLWMAHMVRSSWFLSTKKIDMSQEGNSRTESCNHPPESLGMIRSRFGSEENFESFRYIRVATRTARTPNLVGRNLHQTRAGWPQLLPVSPTRG